MQPDTINRPPRELELSEAEMRAMTAEVLERVLDTIRALETGPTDKSQETDERVLAALREPVPEHPADFKDLLDFVFDKALPMSLTTTSPGFMGYVPGGGLFHVALADFIADAMNRFVGLSAVAPALTEIEASVIRWFCAIIGLPEGAGGFLTSGGSLATLSAITTARHVKLGEDFIGGVLYTSDQSHHCFAKSARLAGFPERHIRKVPADSTYRLDMHALEAMIAEDKGRSLRPFLIAANAGTTNTGAVDPLPAVADLAARESMWFHVDGAYGGFFAMTARGKAILKGIERADSLVLDPHKALFLPYGTGALLVRNKAALAMAHHSEAAYLPDMNQEDLTDFAEISPELTRPFRGLRIWLPFKMHGVGVFRRYLDEKLDLVRWIHDQLSRIDEIEVLAPPDLSTMAFAVRDDGGGLAERNAHSRALMQHINGRQRVYLSGTTLNGIFAIRISILAFRTHKDRLEMLLEDIKSGLAGPGT